MIYGLEIAAIETFILTLIRIVTALSFIPVFENRAIPIQVRMGISVLLAAVLTSIAQPHMAQFPPGLLALASAAISEALVGLVFGLVTMLVLVGAQFAGSIIGIQMGFGIARAVDPQFGGQTGIVSQLTYMLALIIFVVTDIHLHFLEVLGRSFEIIPLGGVIFNHLMMWEYVRITAEIFVIGVKLGAPVIAILFLTQVGLGIVARVMPRMNVFIVGYPVKIAVGFIALILSFPLFIYVLEKVFKFYEESLGRFIVMLAGL